MNTYLKKYVLLLICFTMALTLAACVTDRHESLRTSVARLDDASAHFSMQIQYQGEDLRRDRLSRDADLMARAARKLDRDLSDGRTRTEVQEDYLRVSDSYEQLHKQLADEGYAEQNRRVLEDFDRVTAAYRDVQAAMSERTADLR
jgi:hypothetical protein